MKARLPYVNARLTAVGNWTGAENAVLYDRDVIDVGQDLSESHHSILFLGDIGFEPVEGDTVVFTPIDMDTGVESPPVTRNVRDAIWYQPIHLLRIEAWDA